MNLILSSLFIAHQNDQENQEREREWNERRTQVVNELRRVLWNIQHNESILRTCQEEQGNNQPIDPNLQLALDSATSNARHLLEIYREERARLLEELDRLREEMA